MTNIIKSVHVALLFALLLVALPFAIFAQEGEGTSVEAVTVAKMTMTEATIVSQTADMLTLSFILENQDTAPQSDLRYGAELTQVLPDGSQVVVDSVIGKEVVSVAGGQRLPKVLKYPLSSVAPGTYTVWLSARTAGGVVVGIGMAGEVTVTASQALEIKADTCTLTIPTETGTTYNLYQGVDIATNESLVLNCVVKNHSNTERLFTPVYENYRRSVFGELVEMSYPTGATETIAAGAEETITLTLPVASAPQAYDITVALKDVASAAILSNRLTTHYVLQGSSATIQTVNFSETRYQAGELIALDLFWTGSADGFFDARGEATNEGAVTAVVQISDAAGVLCAAPITQALDDSGRAFLTTKATTDCVSPQALVTLQGANGSVLDSRTIDVIDQGGAPDTETLPATDNRTLMVVTVTAFAIALLMTLFAMTRHKKIHIVDTTKTLALFAIIAGSFLTGVIEVEAVSWNHRWSNSEGWHNHNVTVNVNKTTFSPGETVYLSSVIYNADCANNSIPIHRLTSTLQGVTITLSTNPLVNTSGNKYGSGTFTAPTTPGTYTIRNTMTTLNRNESSYANITITVVAPIPSAPTTISATCNAPGSPVSISWNSVSGATYYAFRLSSGATQLVTTNVSGTSYNTFTPTLDTNYSTWVHACNASGCSSGSAATNFTCATPPPPTPPTATVSATSCEIPVGASTCPGTTTWEINDATNPNVHNSLTNTTYSTNDSGTNVPANMSYGVNTVNARDNSSTLASTNVTVSCVAGSSWNGTICDTVPPPPPSPAIDLSLSRELIRSGETVDVTVEVTAEYATECTLYGAETTPIVFTHNGTPANPTSSDVTTSRPLRAAQVVTVTCEPNPANGATSNTATSRVDVIPVVQEI